MMKELAPGLYHVPGRNKSRFPYCACLYAAGRRARVLIDAGMGASRLAPVQEAGIDRLFFTHCHIDHRLTRREIPNVPASCHPLEAPYFCDQKRFLDDLGFSRGGLELEWMYESDGRLFAMAVSPDLADDAPIDIGGLTLQPLLTPGHSPGHLSFYIPEYELVFTGDIDLTSFGPFYGHDVADIKAIEASADRLKALGAKTVVTGHGGVFTSGIQGRFDAFKAVIEKRHQAILNLLERPRRLFEIVGRGVIFSRIPEEGPYRIINRWFEQVHIEKHLDLLQEAGLVRQDPETGKWHRRSAAL
jgi:glyoxylase-like metal-dependent hydrolase (beta-lactamase superfamily II)